jgi:DNA ligase-1
VQLSNTFKRDYAKHKLEEYILSYKLDGLRCIALRESSDEYYNKGKWTLYTRKGKEFLTVDHIKPQLEVLYERHGWSFFDGELYKHGLPFEEIQGPLMAFTRGQVPGMEYHVFVAGHAEKFLSGKDPNHVEPLAGPAEEGAPDIHYVNIGTIPYDKVEETLEEAFEKGYEGIMLRDPNKLYDYKRSNALLKLKNGKDDDRGEIISDCVVESIEYNDYFPVIEDEKLITKRLLNKIWVIQDNEVKCKVGSGYSLDFRYKYTENPSELIGKIVEVQHQDWGANGRMRFPRLIRVREDL